MLIVFNKTTKKVISVSGIRGSATAEVIDRMTVVDLPEGQDEYRIYDNETINQVWQALDAGGGVELVFDGEMPTGIQIIDLPDPPPEELI